MKVARVGNLGVLTILGSAAALAWIVRDHLTTPYDTLLESKAKTYKLDANLLRAIGRHESGFVPNARDPKSGTYANGSFDVGMMQINTLTGSAYGYSATDLLDPVKNVDAACRLLVELRRQLGDRFSDFTWCAAYNVGPDLKPAVNANAYGAAVMWHWQLYSFGRMFA